MTESLGKLCDQLLFPSFHVEDLRFCGGDLFAA